MSLYQFEQEQYQKGYRWICGLDEAGRGPLAGPVFAAAVILPRDLEIPGLNDSKKLTEKKREALYGEIVEKAVAYGIGAASQEEIDRVNILNASMLAMERAFGKLQFVPDAAFVDGNRTPQLPVPTQAVIKGDGISASIAAASILAKVSRDRFMLEMDQRYPEYDFARHKGYPTKLHYERLRTYGPCEIHRATFLKKVHDGKL